MANYAVTDLTFTPIRVWRDGGTRAFRRVYGTILIPAGALTYPTGGVPISGITNPATGAVVAATALACPGLGFVSELLGLQVLANGNAAGLDDGYIPFFDSGVQAEGTAPTSAHKLRLMRQAPSTGTVAAPTFTGSALAAHSHTLHLNDADQADAANNRVNAATGKLGCNTGGDIEIAGVASAAGVGGIIDITAGTPAGTNSAPAFTGTAATTLRFVEHTNDVLGESLTVYVLAFGW